VSRRNSSVANSGVRGVPVGVNPETRVSGGPRVVFDGLHQSGANRILFDMTRDSFPLVSASDPSVVGFTLPERLAGSVQELVCLPRGGALERFQELVRRDGWQKQCVDVIRHDGERSELVVPEGGAAVQGIDDEFGDWFFRQENRACAPAVEIRIHPGESVGGCALRGLRKSPGGQAVMKGPGGEYPATLWSLLGQAAMEIHKPDSAGRAGNFSIREHFNIVSDLRGQSVSRS